MNINPLSKKFNISLRGVSEKEISPELPVVEDKELIMKELDKMGKINSVKIEKKNTSGDEINLSLKELQKRTHKDYLTTKKMLAVDAPEYLELAEGDKKALKHLVKAATVIDKIFIGAGQAFTAQIVSDKHEEINLAIRDEVRRTTTMFVAYGGYSKESKTVLLVTFTMDQYATLMSVIKRIDPKAFVSISRAHEINGEGFTYGTHD